MTHEAPLRLHRETVQSEWADYNGHLNESYYVLIFSHATDAFMDYIGLDDATRRRTLCSLFTLENHVNYLSEVKVGAVVRVESRIVRHDAKRIQLYHEMFLSDGTEPVAAMETMQIHVDTAARRSAPFRPEVAEKVAAIGAAHEALPPARWSGRRIAMPEAR
ncbi:MAG: thioesterase family protein [Pseudomonadota bacterium]